MRWAGQQVTDDGALPGMPALKGLVRSVSTPEFAGVTFHEVRARSVLNRVPGASPMPFAWTVNPYRGCSHACTYCLVGSTPVLRADGGSVPMAQLRVGDAVVGSVAEQGMRRLVRTEVRDHWTRTVPTVRLRLADGSELRTGPEHRVLTTVGWRHVVREGCAGDDGVWLVPGDVVVGAETLPAPGLAGVRDVLADSRGADRTVVAVEPAGEALVHDVTTGTGDYVAAGLLRHNCFARNTHTYLDLDAGGTSTARSWSRSTLAEVLARELAGRRGGPASTSRIGTNTDPYQRAEGRYRLMPGIIRALPVRDAVLGPDQGHAARPRPAADRRGAAQDVPVGVGVSIALLDHDLHRSVEPGTPTPRARLDLVRRITDAGLPCGVFVAPVLPRLTDSDAALDALLGEIAAAGAAGRLGARAAPAPGHPRVVPRLAGPRAPRRSSSGTRRSTGAGPTSRRPTATTSPPRVAPLLRRHGLDGGTGMGGRSGGRVTADDPEPWPDGALPRLPERVVTETPPEQLSLL